MQHRTTHRPPPPLHRAAVSECRDLATWTMVCASGGGPSVQLVDPCQGSGSPSVAQWDWGLTEMVMTC